VVAAGKAAVERRRSTRSASRQELAASGFEWCESV
jgi:hypothetical protein